MWISPICAHCQEGAVERWWVNISVLWMHRQASKMVWILDTVQLVYGTVNWGSSEQNHLWWMCPRRSTPIKRSPSIPYLFLVCYWNLKNTRRQGSYLFKSINSWLCPGMQLPLLCAMSAPCLQSCTLLKLDKYTTHYSLYLLHAPCLLLSILSEESSDWSIQLCSFSFLDSVTDISEKGEVH